MVGSLGSVCIIGETILSVLVSLVSKFLAGFGASFWGFKLNMIGEDTFSAVSNTGASYCYRFFRW